MTLLVIDNVDDPALLAPEPTSRCLPSGDHLHVLATTRLDPDRLPGVDCLALDALPDEDAVRLLEKYRKPEGDEEWKGALKIVRRLGGHALAVETVAVFLWKNPSISYRDYLIRLAKEGLAAVEAAAVDDRVALSRHPKTLLGPLMAPTLDGLSPTALRVIEYASLLPPGSLPMPWLRELARRDFPDVVTEPAAGYPDPWQQIVRRLLGLQLLSRTHHPGLLRMHRLVQDVVLARMTSRLGEPPAEATVESRDTAGDLEHKLIQYATDRSEFLAERWFNPQLRSEIEAVHHYAPLILSQSHVMGGVLADRAAFCLRCLGRPVEACQLMRRAVAILESEIASLSDPSALAIHHINLASAEMRLGNMDEAYRSLSRAWEIGRAAPGKGSAVDPGFLSKAGLIESVGENLPAARELFTTAIATIRQAGRDDDPWLVELYSNLGEVELKLGNPTATRELLLEAVKISESIYGSEHPSSAALYSNLAACHLELGDLDTARQLVTRAMAIGEKLYSPNHPELAVRLAVLANVEERLGP